MQISRTACVISALAAVAGAQTQTVRNSTPPLPPNPLGFLLDPAGAPIVGETWSPVVDDTVFVPPVAPGSTWFVGVCTGPASPEVQFPGGVILVDLGGPNPLAQFGPLPVSGGPQPFDVAIPPLCDIIGLSVSTQAFVKDPAAGFRVTNAIDVTVGAGPAGLYMVNAYSDRLRKIDPTTGGDLSSVPITVPGLPVARVHGMAEHPFTGELFVILDYVSPQRALVTVCPITGEGELRGPTEHFAGIAFDSNGTLWGVTGQNTSAPESLFVIDPADGTSSFVTVLGNGTFGEMLGFNPNDGLLYHGSGGWTYDFLPNILETIDPADPLAPPVAIAADTSYTQNAETNALSAFDASIGAFWWGTGCCSGGSKLLQLDTAGNATLIGPTSALQPKGLAVLD